MNGNIDKFVKENLSRENADPSSLLQSLFTPLITSISADSSYNQAHSSSKSSGNENPEAFLQNIFQELTSVLEQEQQEVENNILYIQHRAALLDTDISKNLDQFIKRLEAIEKSSSSLQAEFIKSSGSAVKIGERLTLAEHERNRLSSAINLMTYIKYFEEYGSKLADGELNQILSKSIDQVRLIFPESVRNEDIGVLAEVLSCHHSIFLSITLKPITPTDIT
jgi:hypothetical protein